MNVHGQKRIKCLDKMTDERRAKQNLECKPNGDREERRPKKRWVNICGS
jgi:hypothetical protein